MTEAYKTFRETKTSFPCQICSVFVDEFYTFIDEIGMMKKNPQFNRLRYRTYSVKIY